MFRRKPRYVDVDIQMMEVAPERQHIPTKKWRYLITISFHRLLPAIPPKRFGELNKLLLLTEADRVLVGIHFITVYTDEPEKYDPYELARLACECFGYKLGQHKELKPLLEDKV